MKLAYAALPVVTIALLISGCGDEVHEDIKKRVEKRVEDTSNATAQIQQAQQTPARRKIDMAQMVRGSRVFEKNCIACHGANANGAPNWKQRGADGKFQAPPLNGKGHAWHHPMDALKYTINNGTIKRGGGMPAWKGKLSEQEIADVIAWFQSKWPNELYNAWAAKDRSSRK